MGIMYLTTLEVRSGLNLLTKVRSPNCQELSKNSKKKIEKFGMQSIMICSFNISIIIRKCEWETCICQP